jgi:uncharacterized membrane protein YqaE (UPF0057 family)
MILLFLNRNPYSVPALISQGANSFAFLINLLLCLCFLIDTRIHSHGK